jgi:hypothetical protein
VSKRVPEPPLRILPGAGGAYVVVAREGLPDEARYPVDPNRMTCGCAAGGHHRVCRHMRAVFAHLADDSGPA